MGLPKIGAVLALDGEREYKAAISSVNAAQRELRSELKLASEEFYGQENSMEALARKQEIFVRQQEEQEEKVRVCREAVNQYAKAQEEAGQKVEEAAKRLSEAEDRLEELKNTTGATNEEIEAQKEAVAQARAELEAANKASETAKKKTTEWATSLNNAEAEQKKINRSIEENRVYMNEAENAVDHCATSIDQYGKRVREASEATDEFGQKTTNALTSLSAILTSGAIVKGIKDVAGTLKDCADAAAEFETAMAKVETIADTSKVPIGEMRKEILSTSNDLKVGVEAIADATYNAISAGQATEKAVEFAGQATKLSIGGFTDATTAVDILTTTLNAYNLEAEKTESISDMLVTTQNLGKTTVAELGANMGRVIPLAAAYNVQMDNLSTAYAIMTANGIATAETTTYIKSMMGELGDSGSKVSGILQEKTGKSFAQLSQEGDSLGDVMGILGDAVEGDATRFSELWSSSEAGIGALSLLNSGTEKYNTTLKAMQNSTGATEKAFRTMADTTEMAQAGMENSIRNLKIAIGEELKPELEEAYNWGTDLALWATEFVEQHPEVVKALAALAAGTAAFAGTLTLATTAMEAFKIVKTLVDPTALLATAILGVATAAVAFAASMGTEQEGLQKTNLETQALIKSAKELDVAYAKGVAERTSARQSMETEASVCQNLAKELSGLQSKTNLTAEEQSRMQMIVNELNQAMPDLNLAIDEQTGKLNMSAQALLDNVEAMNELAVAAAAQEDLNEIAAQQYEAHKQLLELQEQLTEQTNATAEAEAAYNEALERAKETGDAIEAQQLDLEWQRALEAQQELEEQIQATQDTYNALGEEWARTNEFIADTTAQYEAATAVQELGDTVDETGTRVSATAESLQQAFSDMGESIKQSVQEQMDIFSEYEKKNAISGEQIISNMESQVQGMQDWGENLSALAGRADENGLLINEGLLSHLVDLGPEGAAYVQAFVDMTDEELQRASELWAESISLPDTIAEQFTESGRNVVAGLVQGIEENAPVVDSTLETVGTDGVKKLDKALGNASPSKKTMESGKNLMLGLSNGIKNNELKVTTSMKETATATVDTAKTTLASSVSNEIGKNFSEGLAGGIRAGKSSVINAAVEVAKAAVAAAKAELGIHSPSKVTEEMGGYYMDGWVIGIQDKIGNLKDAVQGALSESLIQEVEGPSVKTGQEAPAVEAAGQTIGNLEIYIQPQQMTEDELERTFNYINERFGFAL